MNLNKNLLCLKWDDFDNFVVSGLSNLYQKDDMSDTTLFCDGRSFKAHKIVLSIWSSYFREIFSATTHAHPVVVLRETKSSDLELILRFIYQGQLFVPFEDTERFLKTAEYFHIAGLNNMRVHLSTSERNPDGGSSPGSNGSPGKSASGSVGHGPATIVGVHPSANVNGIPMISQTFQNPSYSGQGVHHNSSMASIDGIPVHVLGSSSSSLNPISPTHHADGHPNSSVNPISIIANNSNLGGHPPSQFSTNVIKPIPSRQQPNRVHQPALLSPTSSTNTSSSYGHNLSNPCNRQGQELMYGTQPILVVHNQHQKQISEYHDGSKSMPESNRSSEQVLVFERIGADDRKISSMDHQSLGSGIHETMMNNCTNNHMHQNQEDEPEQVLGLAYLHENNSSRTSSNHSHIIREAAVAGVGTSEDTEIIEMNRDSSTFSSSTDSTATIGKPTKITNSIVLAPATSAPVYAVKRVPSHTSSSISEGSKASSSKSKTTTNNSNSSRIFRSNKVKRQRRVSSQNPEIEFVNCPKCDKRVKKTSLKVHIKRTHLEEGTVLICPICGKQISSKGVYYKHMYGHRQKSTDSKPNSTSKSKEESRAH